MKSVIYTSKGFSYSALEDLKFRVDREFGDIDLLVFAVHPEYDLELVAEDIKNLFLRDDFIIFHAIEHFNDCAVVESGISVCCMKFEKKASVSCFCLDDINNENSIERSANYFNKENKKFHIIYAGLCGGKIGGFIEALAENLTYAPINNIVGGVSSGIEKDDEMQTFQYYDGRVIKNGFVVLSFDGMEAAIDVSLGFKPYGITYQITKADGNRLYSVDDGKRFSYIANKMLSSTTQDIDVRNLWYAPLSILSESDGYMVTLRTIEKITDDYVEFFAPLKEGEYFKLSFATPEDLIETDKETAQRLIKKIRKPECSLNFSCIARQYVLEDMQERELEMYAKNFRTGLFGFFTFGEIGPDKMYKQLKFYNETSLAVLMREK
jgi:hypothetical protein